MENNFIPILFLGVLNVLKVAECQLGAVYSPFVTLGDDPHSTQSYSAQDVKVMLNLLQNDNFHHLSTFTVGSPDEPYGSASTIAKCSSIAQTAFAAAQINKEKNQLALSLYQGIYPGHKKSQHKLNTEIEVAFEIVQAANKIYDGTVTGTVLTSNAYLVGREPLISNASVRFRALNLTFGLNVPTCHNLLDALELEKHRQNILEEVGRFDFIVCQSMPTLEDYSRGPGVFKESITKYVSELENTMKGLGSKVKFYLETGWASGMNSSNPYELVEQKDFWEMMGQWANTEKRMVFMFEAFDNPWRTEEHPYPSHYGLWKHLSNEVEHSMSSYTRKISKVETHNAHPKEHNGSGKPRNNDVTGGQRANDGLNRGIFVASFGFMIFMLNFLG